MFTTSLIPSKSLYLNGKCTRICQFVEAGNNPEVILLYIKH